MILLKKKKKIENKKDLLNVVIWETIPCMLPLDHGV